MLKGISPQLTAADVEQIVDLIDVGELRVAFENLCTQLYERDAVCSIAEVQEIAVLGTALGISQEYWVILAAK